MQISIDKRYSDKRLSIDENNVIKLVSYALDFIHAPKQVELSISFVDNAEIKNLNRDYRDIDKVTDVLSFECDDPDKPPISNSNHCVCLGDIVIAPVFVNVHRLQFGTSFEEELALVIVHGCLHVMGYDHITDDEAEEMESLEKEILDSYGLKGIR